jgi:hypothetical protein
MKNIPTFENFINESNTSFVDDKGVLKTKLGSLKYIVQGGLDRGGDRGSYKIEEDKLSSLISSIDMKSISKILKNHGIELDVRPSEFILHLLNSAMGYNGLGAIDPKISFSVSLPKDWPARENGWVITREEYGIYQKLNDELEKATKSKSYWIRFSSESAPQYGSKIDPKDPKITINFEQGSLS